ncbi:M16 family metallopeptidase, partial [Hansschlegelia beijingensis]
MANHILGGGSFSSRLFTEVREKRGLAYSVYSYLSPYDHAGMFLGGVATRNDRAGQSIDLIQAEIRRMATEGPTPKELDGARKYLIGSYALRFDTSTKIANQLVHLQLDELGIDYVARRNDLVDVPEGELLDALSRLQGLLSDAPAVPGGPDLAAL